MRGESQESHLLGLIREAPSGPDRVALINELENAPVDTRTFYERWLFIHEVAPFWDCWSDDGYNPLNSKFPRDIQLLAAAGYGKADIDNGGFHQFFRNGTGVFAPELAEWFERAGLSQSATLVRDAMAVFGDKFPRSQDERREFLAKFKGESRAEWDPFYQMDSCFYEIATDQAFDLAANHWLRNVCGITRLQDGY